MSEAPATPTSRPSEPRARSISEVFRVRKERGQAALIPYICAGHPSRDESLALMHAAVEAGADLLEIGVPFSDPLADGPTIQKATFEALEGGMTVRGALDLLREFRRDHDTPVVLFTYLNPVYHFGLKAFVKAAKEAGAQGLLLTDLPAGADPELERAVPEGGLSLIRLLAPTTVPDRVREIAEGASGFLYYISRAGVTGARTELRGELGREVEVLRELVELPIAVGFGISTPEQAALVGAVADGVVVGSALIDAVDRGGVDGGRDFLASLRVAMDRGA
ncbi:MAG: tryptophan synthase subunit alpha [Gemmatimonadota bacterium]